MLYYYIQNGLSYLYLYTDQYLSPRCIIEYLYNNNVKQLQYHVTLPTKSIHARKNNCNGYVEHCRSEVELCLWE